MPLALNVLLLTSQFAAETVSDAGFGLRLYEKSTELIKLTPHDTGRGLSRTLTLSLPAATVRRPGGAACARLATLFFTFLAPALRSDLSQPKTLTTRKPKPSHPE